MNEIDKTVERIGQLDGRLNCACECHEKALEAEILDATKENQNEQ